MGKERRRGIIVDTIAQLTLVLGGTRSGKSKFALALAREAPGSVTFLATARPSDDEMKDRIRAHRRQRPSSWTTIEPGYDFLETAHTLSQKPEETVLLDEITLLVSSWLEEDRTGETVFTNIEAFLEQVKKGETRWILVSALVNRGIVPADPYTRRFRDVLGQVHQTLAGAANQVFELTAGIPKTIKRPDREPPPALRYHDLISDENGS